MRKNILLKSMLRQPLKTGLLVLLIFLASFAFFLRTVEFVTVHSEILELGNLYETNVAVRAETYYADVSLAAEILENSDLVGFVDRRIAVEAVLHDLETPDRTGMVWGLPREEQARVSEVIFVGTVTDDFINSSTHRTVYVNAVLGGGDILTSSGERLLITFPFTRQIGLDLSPGATFLFRGRYYQSPLLQGLQSPRGFNYTLNLVPLFEGGPLIAAINDPIVYETRDDVFFLNHESRTVQLQTTRDMTRLPEFQRNAPFLLGYGTGDSGRLFRVVEGREITYDDYINGNAVAVVNNMFRLVLGLGVGDTFRISVPRDQYVAGVLTNTRDIRVRTLPNSYNPNDFIELTIVGVYIDNARSVWDGSFGASVVYIPPSILPDDVVLTPPEYGVVEGWYNEAHLPSSWFNITLANSRYEQDFVERYTPILAEHGLRLIVFESRSLDFWNAVDPMLLTVLFNAVVFWFVLILVTILVVYLFMQQKRKEIAISRALGFSKSCIVLHILICILFFSVPSVVIGGFIGWQYALTIVNETLSPLASILDGIYGTTLGDITIRDLIGTTIESTIIHDISDLPVSLHHLFETDVFSPTVELSSSWFLILTSLVMLVVFVFVFFGNYIILKLPVLEQLQNTASKKQKIIIVTPSKKVLIDYKNFKMPQAKYSLYRLSKHLSVMLFIVRHLKRTPWKSFLGILVTMFFVIAFGWFSESITSTEETIEMLYDTNIVEARVNDPMLRRTIDLVRESGYLYSDIMEASHNRAFIIPMMYDGTFPQDWYYNIGYDTSLPIDQNYNVLNTIFALNNLSLFIDEHTLYVDDVNVGLNIDFDLFFNPETDFIYNANNPIPIIIAQSIKESRNINIGDIVYIGYTASNIVWLDYTSAVIVGIHDELIMRPGLEKSFIMPSDAFEEMFGHMVRYDSFSFIINPVFNRTISEVREVIERLFSPGSISFMDYILRTIVGVTGQTLLLLQLAYPIALWASIILAGGLNLLLMLQNAKRAAILRVLGRKKVQVILLLVIEQLMLTVFGALLGFIVSVAFSTRFDDLYILAIILYLIVVISSTVIGSFMIVKRSPLDMLQVRE